MLYTWLLLLKQNEVWVNFKRSGSEINDDFWQKIEYENIPSYCLKCSHQGHLEEQCKKKEWNVEDDEQTKVGKNDNGQNKDIKELKHVAENNNIGGKNNRVNI